MLITNAFHSFSILLLNNRFDFEPKHNKNFIDIILLFFIDIGSSNERRVVV